MTATHAEIFARLLAEVALIRSYGNGNVYQPPFRLAAIRAAHVAAAKRGITDCVQVATYVGADGKGYCLGCDD